MVPEIKKKKKIGIPHPICCESCCLWANEVLVTVLIWLPYDGVGLGTAPVGVTDGLHVEPPLCTVISNELPERTMMSCASLCRRLYTSTLFTLITESPAIKPAWSAILPMLTCKLSEWNVWNCYHILWCEMTLDYS